MERKENGNKKSDERTGKGLNDRKTRKIKTEDEEQGNKDRTSYVERE